MTDRQKQDWKLKLRYGKLSAPFEHCTLIAEGGIFDANKSATGTVGPAMMAMKVWASTHDEAFDMIELIGEHVGFRVSGQIQLFETDPQVPPVKIRTATT